MCLTLIADGVTLTDDGVMLTADGVVLYRDLLLDEDVKRISSCELEVDIVAADILNRHEVDGL